MKTTNIPGPKSEAQNPKSERNPKPATACFAYFTLAALYDLGRVEDGDKIFMPMLDSFAKGDFQGRDASGMSKDWRTWTGKCWGYEGMLTDNYYALLAVMDREAALNHGARNLSDK